jgi:hypothetical protein
MIGAKLIKNSSIPRCLRSFLSETGTFGTFFLFCFSGTAGLTTAGKQGQEQRKSRDKKLQKALCIPCEKTFIRDTLLPESAHGTGETDRHAPFSALSKKVTAS